MSGPEGDAYFCDACEDNPKRCNKRDCPGAPQPATTEHWPLVVELAEALEAIRDAGLLHGPTVKHDKCREILSEALSSYYDADNVR